MKKLSVFIEGSKKTITTSRSLEIQKNTTLVVKSASVFWDYKNVIKGYNDVIQYGGVKYTIPEGYWSFVTLETYFSDNKDIGITISHNIHNHTCTLETKQPAKLYKFGELLGFPTNTTMNTGEATSPGRIDINRGLRFIEIHCDTLVDETINSSGKQSSIIAVLPITSESTLSGSVLHFPTVESSVPTRSGVYNNITFHITTNMSGVNEVGNILLDINMK